MKVDVIALKGFGITKKGGRARLPEQHAKVLERMGFLRIMEKEVAPAAPVVPKKGTYARRDMTAESRSAHVSYTPTRKDYGKAE